jgi:hypothetical protein
MTASQPNEGLLRWLPRGYDTRWILLVAPAAAAGVIAGALPNPFLIVAGVGAVAFFAASLEYPVAALALFVLLTFVSQIAGVGASVSVAKGAGGVLVAGWLYRRFAGRAVHLGVAPVSRRSLFVPRRCAHGWSCLRRGPRTLTRHSRRHSAFCKAR